MTKEDLVKRVKVYLAARDALARTTVPNGYAARERDYKAALESLRLAVA
jgi:hypothetical protein